jgi:nucleotide-binding universal stress UspA family protein
MSLLDVRRVVVPVDFSKESLSAVDTALELVHRDPSKIYLIHVLADMSPADPGVIWGEINDVNRAMHVKQALLDRLPNRHADQMNTTVAFGDAGFRIAEFARTVDADLIVIPSHGRTGIEHLLIGSVAERVIQYAHCPVLVLRGTRASAERSSD